MPRIGIVGDMHAGIGKNDKDLRGILMNGINRSMQYMQDLNLDELILNGDTTDHLANALSGDTDRDLCREMCRPIVSCILAHRDQMKTTVLAGNTDWVIAEEDPSKQRVFFHYTGLQPADVTIPQGGLEYLIETEDCIIDVVHGHMQKPETLGNTPSITIYDHRQLMEQLRHPSRHFLDAISSVKGAHRNTYLLAAFCGLFVRPLPRFGRRLLNAQAGYWAMTRAHEPAFARMLQERAANTPKVVTGVIGHTHQAGARYYGSTLVLNHGTSGAKPSPLERTSDPKAHVIIIDTKKMVYELIQTYDPARPGRLPQAIQKGLIPSKMAQQKQKVC